MDTTSPDSIHMVCHHERLLTLRARLLRNGYTYLNGIFFMIICNYELTTPIGKSSIIN
jgi:hypothetical protein